MLRSLQSNVPLIIVTLYDSLIVGRLLFKVPLIVLVWYWPC